MAAVRLIPAFLLCALAAGTGHANGTAELPLALDLQRDGRQAEQEGKPLVILFSLPDCQFCHEVRQNYLAPLLRGVPVAQRPIIREIEMANAQTFAGLRGERTSHQEFARKLQVRAAPTVVFLDAAGRPLVAPIVGGDIAGLYGGYLDNAFAAAAQKLSAAKPNQPIGAKP